jgi:hypothetical protein
MHQKGQKNNFCDVTKVENFDKKCLTLSKKKQKSPFKHFRFDKAKSPVKVLTGFKTIECQILFEFLNYENVVNYYA